MPHKQEHREEVGHYLQQHFRIHNWGFSLPRGSGMETYFAKGDGQDYFVKVGAPVERYLALSEIGLTPPIITFGKLESGLSIMVQPYIEGRKPSRLDYHNQLREVADLIRTLHHLPKIQEFLPAISSNLYKEAGLEALNRLRSKWEHHKAPVPMLHDFVDSSLEHLDKQVSLFSDEGLVVSHNDICNANWLFASDGKIYIMDFETLSMDDPAADLGALLWWYYPPGLRQRFLDIAGYPYDEEFRFRMQVRMAMHCLSITLPRESSFDAFDHESFGAGLRDFRAVLDGKENPEGYGV